MGAKYTLSIDRTRIDIASTQNQDFTTQSDFRKEGVYSSVQIITVGEGIVCIGDATFDGCTNLIQITLPNSLIDINNSAFSNCQSISEIVFPSGNNFRNYAFNFCYELQSITLPSNMIFWGESMFRDCTKLNRIKVMDNSKFSHSDDYKFLFESGTVLREGPGSGNITIPAKTTVIASFSCFRPYQEVIFPIGSNVQEINDNAFREGKFKKIELPSGIKKLHGRPFEYSILEEITFPKSLTYVSPFCLTDLPIKKITILGSNNVVKKNGSVYTSGDALLFLEEGQPSYEVPLSIQIIPTGILQGCESLKVLNVQPGHSNLTNYSNCLYSKDYSELQHCAGGAQDVNIHPSCTKLLDFCFRNCKGLRSVVFDGTNISTLGVAAFESCTNMISIVLKEGLKSIANYCFTGGILDNYNITFPSTLESIGAYSFANSKILSANFSQCINVKRFEINTFAANQKLSSIILPPQLTYLGDSALMGSALKAISIPPMVDTIFTSCFLNSKSLSSVTFEGNSLAKIYARAFEGCALVELHLPSSVAEIEQKAFANNLPLSIIEFPTNSQLTSLQSNIFEGCGNVTSVYLGPKVNSISTGALSMMSMLINITVDTNNKHYSSKDGVLYNFDQTILIVCPGGFTALKVPESVKKLGDSAFYGCSNLNSIDMENVKLETIPPQSFYGCTSLTSITIPSSVQKIEANAFDSCSALSIVEFENGSLLTELGASAFLGCRNLHKVHFGEGSKLSTIGKSTFENCNNLQSFTFPSDLLTIGENAFKKSALITVALNANLQTIGASCFQSCQSLEMVIIQGTVTSIGESAFTDCPNLTRVFYCGSNDLGSTIAFDADRAIAAYAGNQYPVSSSLGGLNPIRVLDEDCSIPSTAFTAVESKRGFGLLISTTALISDIFDREL